MTGSSESSPVAFGGGPSLEKWSTTKGAHSIAESTNITTAMGEPSSIATNSASIFLAGAISGLMSDAAVHPLDSLRTRLAARPMNSQNASNSIVNSIVPDSTAGGATLGTASTTGTTTSNASLSTAKKNRGTLSLLRSIYQTEGLRALYQGFGIVAFASVGGHALYFYAYELSKKQLGVASIGKKVDHHKMNKTEGQDYKGGQMNGVQQSVAQKEQGGAHSGLGAKSTLAFMASGLIADVCGSVIWTPMDVVKQRMMLIQRSDSGANLGTNSFYLFMDIFKKEGLRGLYRGFIPGLITYGPYVSIYFTLYETFKHSSLHYLHQNKSTHWLRHLDLQDNQLPLPFLITGSFLSAAISSALTTPLDVVKTRIQTQFSTFGTLKYNNFLHAIRIVLKEEGPRALFQGGKARMWWMSLGTGITMGAYEMIFSLFPSNRLL